MRASVRRPIAGGRLQALPLQAAPKPVEVSKKDGTLTRPATDGAQDGDLPAFFTEGALLRLEEGLRAQREQQERRLFSEPDAVSSRTGSSGGRQTEEHLRNNVGEAQRTITQVPRSGAHGSGVQTVDSAEQTFAHKDSVPRLPDEIAHRRSPYWRWLKVDLLLCVLLLIVGAAALGVSLEARTRGSTDAPPDNVKANGRTASVSPDNDQPRQPIANAVKSPAATPSLPPPSPPNKQAVEAQAPATTAASETPATPSLPPPSPPNKQAVEAQAPATTAASETSATPSLPPPSPPNKQAVEAQAPATTAAETSAASPQCNIPVCQQFYRSFRRSDCTYQPFSGGPRRICSR